MPTTQLPFATRNSTYVVDEINAYIATRDGLLMEAEQTRTAAALDRAMAANDFVENCLQSPRHAYASQHLPETVAARERARCQVVKARVAELRRKSA
jgi:hypothetical protein